MDFKVLKNTGIKGSSFFLLKKYSLYYVPQLGKGLPFLPQLFPILGIYLTIELKSAQVILLSPFWPASAPMAIPRIPFGNDLCP